MGSRDYSINYDEGLLYLRKADYERKYLISYSYWDKSGVRPRLVTVSKVSTLVTAKTATTDPDPEEVQIMAPDPANPAQLIWVKDIPGFAGIEEGTDTIRRQFRDITPPPTPPGANVVWSLADPYEFVIRDPVAGILAFNPLGYGYEELTSTGRSKLTAYIDYDVMDWHVIHDERKVPSTTASADSDYINVKLSLRALKNKGTTNYDNSSYLGINTPSTVRVGSTPDPAYQSSVVAIDTESGAIYDEYSFADTIKVPALSVNYKDGVIGFHKSLHDRTFVIMYQATDDWAVQVFKAFSVYTRRYDIPANLDDFNYDNYYLGADERIYFPRCYAGATVGVSYAYRANGATADSFVQGESFQISRDVDATTGLCYVDIKQKLLDSGKTGVQITQVSKVYGTSVGVRVIWRVSGRGLASSWRWRKVDVQTYLTRPNN